MSLLRYTDDALADVDRLSDFLRESDPTAADVTVGIIANGLAVLAMHPLVGRQIDGGLRELVISHGHSGYLALYRYDPHEDSVAVLAIRHQRESGFDE